MASPVTASPFPPGITTPPPTPPSGDGGGIYSQALVVLFLNMRV